MILLSLAEMADFHWWNTWMINKRKVEFYVAGHNSGNKFVRESGSFLRSLFQPFNPFNP
jgi:hypothetical protein